MRKPQLVAMSVRVPKAWRALLKKAKARHKIGEGDFVRTFLAEKGFLEWITRYVTPAPRASRTPSSAAAGSSTTEAGTVGAPSAEPETP
jgi:hypothetical protein